MKKKIYLVMCLISVTTHRAAAQSLKGDMNTILNDIVLPIFYTLMLIAFLGALAKNWRLIADENSEGNKKQGWINLGIMTGYIAAAITLVTWAVGKITTLTISI